MKTQRKKKRKPLLKLYKEICKVGYLPHPGLCETIANRFEPSHSVLYRDKYREFLLLFEQPYNFNALYWGYGKKLPKGIYKTFFEHHEFTPLRQNLLLLFAAYKGEL